jgi:dolichol-phosphate mannosyltransferase
VTQPRVSIVIPAYNEGDAIEPCLRRIADAVSMPFELIVVVDMPEDTTIPAVEKYGADDPRVRVVVQDLGRGPANAIRYGCMQAAAPCVVVTMADGSDDPLVIDGLVRLVERGCVIAAASRYMPGGQQIGGPRFKGLLSRVAGRTLHTFAGVGTRDATNSYKAYSREFLEEVGIDSRSGFEIGIELVAKARRLRLPIAELPTIWLDRDAGVSNFQLRQWIPEYLKWYRLAYGRELSPDELRIRTQKGTVS